MRFASILAVRCVAMSGSDGKRGGNPAALIRKIYAQNRRVTQRLRRFIDRLVAFYTATVAGEGNPAPECRMKRDQLPR
ncbi:hypothetical protein FJW01_15365 [Pantoea deleyi]|uniref:Uncharacterized protein n=1 Tax=Pantoea deleyi TaxID=470932 RepID=A0A506PZR5_9GAMM|nr:hypothetical protein FJW01_15365 [Pantoea deleyi]